MGLMCRRRADSHRPSHARRPKVARDPRERLMHVGHDNRRARERRDRKLSRHHDGRGAGLRQAARFVDMVDQCNIAGASVDQRPRGMDSKLGVADELASHQSRQFAEACRHDRSPFRYACAQDAGKLAGCLGRDCFPIVRAAWVSAPSLERAAKTRAFGRFEGKAGEYYRVDRRQARSTGIISSGFSRDASRPVFPRLFVRGASDAAGRDRVATASSGRRRRFHR